MHCNSINVWIEFKKINNNDVKFLYSALHMYTSQSGLSIITAAYRIRKAAMACPT